MWPFKKKENPWVACRTCGVVIEKRKAYSAEFEDYLVSKGSSTTYLDGEGRFLTAAECGYARYRNYYCEAHRPKFDLRDRWHRYIREFVVDEKTGHPLGYIPDPGPALAKKTKTTKNTGVAKGTRHRASNSGDAGSNPAACARGR